MSKEQELIIKSRSGDIYAKRELVKMFLPEIKKIQQQYMFIGLNKRELKNLYTNIIEEDIKKIDLEILDYISFIDFINLKFCKLMTGYTDNKDQLYYNISIYIDDKFTQMQAVSKSIGLDNIIKILKILSVINFNTDSDYRLILTNSKTILMFLRRLGYEDNTIKKRLSEEQFYELDRFITMYSEIMNDDHKENILNQCVEEKQDYYKLVVDNLNLVGYVAKEYLNKGVEYDDIMAAGNAGLVMAAKKYDHSRDVQFSTYAVSMIKGQILEQFRVNLNSVVLSKKHYEKISKFKKIFNSLEGDVNEKLSLTADAMDISLEDAILIYSTNLSTISLNTKLTDEDSSELVEFIKDDVDIENDINNSLLVQQLIDNTELSERDKQILLYYYGLLDNKKHTVKETGEKYNLTGTSINKIVDKTLRKIRMSNNISGS